MADSRHAVRYVAVALGLLVLAALAVALGRFRSDMSKARRKALAGSQILRTDRGDVEYAVRREGPPVLVLHGAGGGYDQGLLLGRTSLGDEFRFVSVSRFGYLRSTIPEDASVETQAAFYAALLDQLHIDRAIVLGGSAGGPSALQFAHDYPDRCRALILVSAISMSIAPDRDAFQNRVIQAIQSSDFLYWAITKTLRPMFLQLIGVPPDVYGGFTPEQRELAQELLDVMHPMSQRRAGSMYEFETEPLDDAALSEIDIPTLILHARDDALVSYEHAEFAHRNIPRSELVLFETGGHGLLPRMDEVRPAVSTFLAQIGAGAQP